MTAYYTFIDDTVGLGSTTIAGIQTQGYIYGVNVSPNIGIGTTNPTQPLDVVGNVKFRSGIYDKNSNVGGIGSIITADGNGGWEWKPVASIGSSGITIREETNIVGTAGSISILSFFGNNVTATATGSGATVTFSDSPSFDSLKVTGLSTFTNGPVLIGTGTSTGTAGQPLQVNGKAYFSNSVGINSANPTASLDVIGVMKIGTGTTYTYIGADIGRSIELGVGSTTLDTFIDFQGSATYTDYAARLQRIAGDNSSFNIINRGIGNLRLVTQDAGPIDFLTNNTLKHRVSSDGIFLVGAGTPTGTTNQPLQVNGNTYVSGTLGIGVTSPSQKLQVDGNIYLSGTNSFISNLNPSVSLSSVAGSASTVAQFYHANSNSSYLRIKATRNATGSSWTTASTKLLQVIDVTEMGYIEYNPNGSTFGLAFGQNATEWARFLSSGNLGIGETNPTSKLHVQGNARFVTGSQGDVTITHSNLVSTIKGASTIQLALGANNTEAIRINTSNQVGIGTTNPTSQLHVVGDTLITGITTIGLGTTAVPPSNSQLSFFLLNDTTLRIAARGTDGILRFANITLS